MCKIMSVKSAYYTRGIIIKSYIIYKATNLINNKKYVGKTIKTLEDRKYEHIYKANKGDCYTSYFHNALKLYGIENFKWEVLCECDDVLILNIMETMKIIVEHSHVSDGGYNMTWGGDGLPKGYKHSAETKRKVGESSKGR